MKKIIVIIFAVILLSAPVAAHAFSFVDVVNFGRWLIHKEVKPAVVEVKKQEIVAKESLPAMTAEKKYDNWKNAFEKKDITSVIQDDRNLYFTDAEINFLVTNELAAMSASPVSDVHIAFTENLIAISGNSTLKNLKGQFYLEAKPVEINGRIGLQVTRARYRNFYFPAVLAQSILAGQMKEMVDFLYSSPNYQNVGATVGNGFIELSY